MVLDKFKAIPGSNKISLFTLFGVTNALCYGMSLMMDEKDYKYYFSYDGTGK